MAGIPENLFGAVERAVRGEKILWAGQPDGRGILLTGLGTYLFAIPWTLFALFWESFPIMMLLHPEKMGGGLPGAMGAMPWVFAIFGIPFIVIGFGMLASPFYALKKNRQTAFAITESNLAIVSLGRVLVSQVRPLSGIKRIESVEKANGSGTLKLIFGYGRDSDGDRTTDSEDLAGIENVRDVEDLINRLRQSEPSPAA
jgi:hypothetical protein